MATDRAHGVRMAGSYDVHWLTHSTHPRARRFGGWRTRTVARRHRTRNRRGLSEESSNLSDERPTQVAECRLPTGARLRCQPAGITLRIFAASN